MMQIFVNSLNGKTLTLDVDNFHTIKMIKQKIYHNEGFCTEKQRLIYSGKQLEDQYTLCDYNIENNSMVNLVLRLVGGSTFTSRIEDEINNLFDDDDCQPSSSDTACEEEPITEEDRLNKLNNGLKNIIKDMYNDLTQTFPELKDNIDNDIKQVVTDCDENGNHLEKIKNHCISVLPERFFDILYQNEQIFNDDDNIVNTEFLPGINFKQLWKENISDKSREILWKYLQLLLFTTVSGISNGETFGDTAKIFEAINADDFRKKLEESVTQMQSVFSELNKNGSEQGDDTSNGSSFPDPEEFHKHVSGMMGGKIGKMAKDIADKISKDFHMDVENPESINDVFQSLLKNPAKMMSLVKSVGDELDKKLKSGDIKESDIMNEASEIVKQMKNIPGMKNFQSMFKNMGIDPENLDISELAKKMGMNKKKVNLSATKTKFSNMARMEKQKEIIQAKILAHKNKMDLLKASEELKMKDPNYSMKLKLDEEKSEKAALELLNLENTNKGKKNIVFSTGEKYEKTLVNDNPNKKKKDKKKKK